MAIDSKKRFKEIEDEIKLIEAEQKLNSLKANTSRSRSVSIGTAFGGVTEISMRGDGGEVMWCLLQPVEVTELIHQLAGNIGCHLSLKPREDFASWRHWKEPDSTLLPFNDNSVPHPNDLAVYQQVGTVLPHPEQQPGLKNDL